LRVVRDQLGVDEQAHLVHQPGGEQGARKGAAAVYPHHARTVIAGEVGERERKVDLPDAGDELPNARVRGIRAGRGAQGDDVRPVAAVA
jgi:hypothetical protein